MRWRSGAPCAPHAAAGAEVAGGGTVALALRLVRAVLPETVSVGAVAVGAAEAWPDEMAAVARAVPKRQAEFAAGRAAARAALAGLGLPPVSLPRLPDRLPLWPPGIRGSIAHCDWVALAAVTRSPILPGIDVEPDAPLPEDLVPVVSTPAERASAGHPNAARLVFSAKEAIFKAQFPRFRAWLDFADLAVRLDPGGTFSARLQRASGALPQGHAFAGRWRAEGGLIVTAVAEPDRGAAG